MGKLILAGGGNCSQSKNTDVCFLGLLEQNSNKSLLYIPNAMSDKGDNYVSCLEWIKSCFSPLGFSNINMESNLTILKDLDDYLAVYVGGGNTYKLLSEIKSTNFIEELEDFINLDNGIVYGGSAGAIIFGDDIRSSNDINEIGLSNFEGLNFIKGYSIIPHWTLDKEDRVKELYNMGINRLICIPEDSGLIYDTNRMAGIVIGNIRIYHGEEVRDFQTNQEIFFRFSELEE